MLLQVTQASFYWLQRTDLHQDWENSQKISICITQFMLIYKNLLIHNTEQLCLKRYGALENLMFIFKLIAISKQFKANFPII